ncbi:hypothetical protein C2845_PM10G19790 [Panicum miliaceum]|uniref:Uncharacterized protein n=1 Tax=Panicum miliaceum TaxID=4540 RepID=A0A3L6PEZ1_PANMI|nr:hypothetical protein C2845_PM10G19790 [Panicum miliaceum]
MTTTQPPVPSEPRFAAGPPLMLHRRPLVGPQLASGPGTETHGTCTGSTRRHAGPKSRGSGMEGSEACTVDGGGWAFAAPAADAGSERNIKRLEPAW